MVYWNIRQFVLLSSLSNFSEAQTILELQGNYLRNLCCTEYSAKRRTLE